MKVEKRIENPSQSSLFRFSARFPITVAWASLVIFSIQTLRNSNSESWDRFIYISAILTSIYITLTRSKIFSHPIFLSLGLISLLLGVIGVEKHGTETTSGIDVSNLLWLGFGWIVFLALVFSALMYFNFYSLGKRPNWLRALGILAFFYSTSLALLAAWQTNSSIIDNYHSEYVINEALAVPAGHIPYVDFIPQYGILYSFLLKPFSKWLSPNELVNSLYLMCYVAIIISFFIAIALLHRNLDKKSWIVAALWVIPFTSLAHLPNREGYSGTIFSLISQIPVRIFPGMILAILTISTLANLNSRSNLRNTFRIFVTSIFAGLGFWINQDFVLLSGLISVAMIVLFTKSFKLSMTSMMGYLIGVFLYPLLVQISGNTVQFKYVGFFAVQYGGAYMSEEIITPGPVLIVLPLITAMMAVVYATYIKTFGLRKEIINEDYRRVLTVSFFAVWCLGGFLYYLNRSYASGQMQILFLPLSVALGSFAHMSFWKDHFEKIRSRKGLSPRQYFVRIIPALIQTLLFALPFATVVASSDPRIEWRRISTSPEGHIWPKGNSLEAVSIWTELSKNPNIRKEKVAYFGASGNYVELLTGIKSVNILNSPWDMPVTQVTIRTGCEAITKYNPEYLVVGIEGRSLFRFENNTLCNRYEFIEYENLALGTVAKRIETSG